MGVDDQPFCREILVGSGMPKSIVVKISDLPVLTLPYHDGIILAGPPNVGGVCAGRSRVEFVAVNMRRLPAAAYLVENSPFATAVLHRRNVSPVRAALALVISTHLYRVRTGAGLPGEVVTCETRPTVHDGLIVVSHPVSAVLDTGRAMETQIWEVVRPSQYRALETGYPNGI